MASQAAIHEWIAFIAEAFHSREAEEIFAALKHSSALLRKLTYNDFATSLVLCFGTIVYFFLG